MKKLNYMAALCSLTFAIGCGSSGPAAEPAAGPVAGDDPTLASLEGIWEMDPTTLVCPAGNVRGDLHLSILEIQGSTAKLTLDYLPINLTKTLNVTLSGTDRVQLERQPDLLAEAPGLNPTPRADKHPFTSEMSYTRDGDSLHVKMSASEHCSPSAGVNEPLEATFRRQAASKFAFVGKWEVDAATITCTTGTRVSRLQNFTLTLNRRGGGMVLHTKTQAERPHTQTKTFALMILPSLQMTREARYSNTNYSNDISSHPEYAPISDLKITRDGNRLTVENMTNSELCAVRNDRGTLQSATFNLVP